MTVAELAKQAGVSRFIVYKRIHEIEAVEGKTRMPTLEECKKRKQGRPIKYGG